MFILVFFTPYAQAFGRNRVQTQRIKRVENGS